MTVHKIVLITPGMHASAPDEVKVDGNAFLFKLDTEHQRGTLTLLFSLTGKATLLEPGAFSAYQKDADKLANNLNWTLAISPGAGMADWQAVALAIAFLALFALFVAGLIHANARKNSEQAGEQFYPVPIVKFLLLGAATLGIYQAYWFWRQWRWIMRHEKSEIMPFWRAFFGVFWLYPLFDRANSRAMPRLATWIGVAGAVGYLAWGICTSIADRLIESPATTGLGMLTPLFTVPALVAVNRSNSAEIVRANGKWGWLAIATVPIGLTAALLLFAS